MAIQQIVDIQRQFHIFHIIGVNRYRVLYTQVQQEVGRYGLAGRGAGKLLVYRRFRGENRLGILHRRGAPHHFGTNDVLRPRARLMKNNTIPRSGVIWQNAHWARYRNN